jgi:hypothetical protein
MVFFDILKAMIECLCGGGGRMLLPYLLGVEHGCCCCYWCSLWGVLIWRGVGTK